jgi:dTMP kinase
MGHPRLITIEGIDGAGKSTLATSLARELAARGRPVELLREPGGVEVAERIRALVTDPSLTVSPRAEALLYAAARAQLVHELIEPRLAAGALLLLDRFLDSSLAYQGAGRGLGVEQVRLVNRFALGTLEPRLTLLLRVPPAIGRARKQHERHPPDRLEAEGDDFFTTVASAYEALAREDPARIRVIDATRAPEQVLEDALEAVERVLPAVESTI